MSSRTDAFFHRMSRDSMALILVNEFILGNQTLPELKELLNAFAHNDLDRVGLLELVLHKAKLMGLSPGQVVSLHSGLSPDVGLTSRTLDTQNVTHPTPSTMQVAQGVVDETKSSTPVAPPPPPVIPPRQAGIPSPAPVDLGMPSLSPPESTPSFKVRMPEREKGNEETAASQSKDPPQLKETLQASSAKGRWRGIADSMQTLATNKVLVADDDQRIRMIFRRKLEEAKYLVEEAATGEEAWDMIQQNSYGLVVMDMKMPGLHGLELLARLTAEGGKLPVIVCSAYDQLKDDFVIATYPKIKFFVKPVPPNDLVDAAKKLLPLSSS